MVSSRRRKPSCRSRSDKVSKAGSIVAAPKALRMTRIDKRTASRNAALASSIRCRRSATWRASGSARHSLAVTATPIARHDADPGMLAQPRFGGRLFAVGQQGHHAPTFQIADDGAVAVVAAIGPVIDADHGQRLGSRQGAPTHDAEQRVVADRQHEPLGEPGTRPAAHRQAEMVDDLLEPPGAPGPLGQHREAEPFGEHLARAARHAAAEPPHEEPQAHAASRARQIRGLADVMALSTVRSRTAQRAGRREGIAAVTTSASSLPSTLSTASPGGISDAKPNRAAMGRSCRKHHTRSPHNSKGNESEPTFNAD